MTTSENAMLSHTAMHLEQAICAKPLLLPFYDSQEFCTEDPAISPSTKAVQVV